MTDGNRIQILSDHVANKIAAGEVVDRPASVVKELMENAIDAGATQIDVAVIDGGRKLIVITDNGRGMSRDDALLSVERHATSKIRDVDDIEEVKTLGFRGEALASIASVSRFSIITRRPADLGATEVVIAGGRIQEVREAGSPPGTCFKVRNLFFNVPARRKFLRTAQTEMSHIRQIFMVYALSYPDKGMSLTVDERELFRLPAGAAMVDRLRELYSSEFCADIRPLDWEASGIKLSGYIGAPSLHRADRSDQYIFINGRPASAPLLASALKEGFRGQIPKGRHPVVFLFIDLEPSLVDVNVHPTKKEVRFRRPSDLRDAVIDGIREAMAQSAAASSPSGEAPGPERPLRPAPSFQIRDLPEVRTFQYPRLPLEPEDRPAEGPKSTADAVEPPEESGAAPWAWCRILGQIGGLYVVMETDEGMVLMDPRAAHERVLFESYMSEVLKNDVKGQGMLIPETVELPPKDAEHVRKQVKRLKDMGFGISEFGGDAFMIDALPTCLGNASAQSILAEVALGLEQTGARGGTERWVEEKIAQAACKTAVQSRDRLSLDEIEKLVIDLARAEMPYTSPFGRPTLIFTSFQELNRKFGRGSL